LDQAVSALALRLFLQHHQCVVNTLSGAKGLGHVIVYVAKDKENSGALRLAVGTGHVTFA
jgi:hypothetical protein